MNANPRQANKYDFRQDCTHRVLSLDGGGAKGFYTIGVLKQVEAMVGPLHECFDLIYGTSTGSIIASLIALGKTVDEVHELYKSHVPSIMSKSLACSRTAALEQLASEVFPKETFADFRTGLGIVATKWDQEKPMIFKTHVSQAHGRHETFNPGFGVRVSDAVQASCSAYPFFKRKIVTTSNGDKFELADGGFCANNPTLYALADALTTMGKARNEVKVLSVGVGVYPQPKSLKMWLAKKSPAVKLLQKTLEINTQSMDQLRSVLYHDVETVRINDTFVQPELATDLMEHNLAKLNVLRQRGAESFAAQEKQVRKLLFPASMVM